ncbi:hypothetical protein BBP40_003433 [Aspergillus hancockii]|nr:hypothetical protein BBP40_003433 [Aspergillus hancockii]
MKLSALLIGGLIPAAVLASPAPIPHAEPEPVPQANIKPIQCTLRGDVVSKRFPAGCAPNAGKFTKGAKVTFTCQIFTDTNFLRVGPSGGVFLPRNNDAVLPCIGVVLPKC